MNKKCSKHASAHAYDGRTPFYQPVRESVQRSRIMQRLSTAKSPQRQRQQQQQQHRKPKNLSCAASTRMRVRSHSNVELSRRAAVSCCSRPAPATPRFYPRTRACVRDRWRYAASNNSRRQLQCRRLNWKTSVHKFRGSTIG
jgi:hypothetical protein